MASLNLRVKILALHRPWPWAIFKLAAAGQSWPQVLRQQFVCPLPEQSFLVINASQYWDDQATTICQTITGVPIPGDRHNKILHPTGLVGVVQYQQVLTPDAVSDNRWCQAIGEYPVTSTAPNALPPQTHWWLIDHPFEIEPLAAPVRKGLVNPDEYELNHLIEQMTLQTLNS